jgi:hypothetical protein
MLIYKPTEWHLWRERPGKRIWRRFNVAEDAVEFIDEWDETFQLEMAAQERELNVGTPNLRPLAVIPQSVLAASIKEGWVNDDNAWKRWTNDIDNRNLRILGGSA